MEWKYSRSISGVILAEADADRATLPPALLAFIIRQMELQRIRTPSHRHTQPLLPPLINSVFLNKMTAQAQTGASGDDALSIISRPPDPGIMEGSE